MEIINMEVIRKKKEKSLKFLGSIDDSAFLDDMQISRVEATLKELDELDPPDFAFDAEGMLLEFKSKYEPRAMLHRDEIEKSRVEKLNQLSEIKLKSKQKRKILVFAASFALVLFVFNFRTIAELKWMTPIVVWSEEVLSLFTPTEFLNPKIIKDDYKQYNDFKYIERDYHIELLRVSLTSLGYKLNYIDVFESAPDEWLKIQAFYTNKDQIIQYTIEPIDTKNQWIEKLDSAISEINNNSITYYLFENNTWTQISWSYKNHNYTLLGEFSEEEAQKIIENIK